MQFAWLDHYGEKWLLLNKFSKYPVRSWTDIKAALAELRGEGWTMKPLVRRQAHRLRIFGYAMMRTVH